MYVVYRLIAMYNSYRIITKQFSTLWHTHERKMLILKGFKIHCVWRSCPEYNQRNEPFVPKSVYYQTILTQRTVVPQLLAYLPSTWCWYSWSQTERSSWTDERWSSQNSGRAGSGWYTTTRSQSCCMNSKECSWSSAARILNCTIPRYK